MPSSTRVLARMDSDVTALETAFVQYVNHFVLSQHFSGPCLHFHKKALSFIQPNGSIATINKEGFLEAVYATLASWGMHRMGPGNAKLRELREIRDSVLLHESTIEKLSQQKLCTIAESDFDDVAAEVWSLIDSLKVSVADCKLVANSKLLHHILPNMVPPIDRTYTFNFFYRRNILTIDEKSAFSEMYRRFFRIARNKATQINSLLDKGWNSSITKVLDNAVIGFVQQRNTENANPIHE